MIDGKVINMDEAIQFFEGEARRFRQMDKHLASQNYFLVCSWLEELKARKMQEWIRYEDRELYDGWVAQFKFTGEVEIRPEFEKMLSKKIKDKIRSNIKKLIKEKK